MKMHDWLYNKKSPTMIGKTEKKSSIGKVFCSIKEKDIPYFR